MYLTRNQLAMVSVFLAGTLLAVLNQTLLSPAIPTIMADLAVDTATVQWLTSGYALVEAVVIPLSAFLMGRFSIRRLFIGGMLSFVLGSALSAWSPAFWALLLGRALQALCTGAVMPMVMTVILLTFPVERRGFAMGLVTLIIGFAPAVGPSVGGLVVDTLGWRPLFAVVAALGVLIVCLAAVFVRNRDGFDRVGLDAASVALSSVGMVCLLYGLSTVEKGAWASSAALVAVGGVLVVLFVRRQLRLASPMLQVGVMRAPRYRVGALVSMVTQAAIVGLSVVMPLYTQNVLGFSAAASGMVMMPGALLGALLGMVAGRLFDHTGPRPLVLAGGIATMAGMVGLCFLTDQSGLPVVVAVYSVMMCGLMFLGTPLNTWAINSLDSSLIQHANAVSNTLNQVGASFGTAILVSLMGLSRLASPQSSGVELEFVGCHIAFIAAAILGAIGFCAVVLFVRDGFPRNRDASNGLPRTVNRCQDADRRGKDRHAPDAVR